jgi:phosphate-selective porin OprO/OprP
MRISVVAASILLAASPAFAQEVATQDLPRAEPPPPPPAVDPALIQAIVAEELAKRETITWKDGFHLQTADNAYKLNVNAYTHFDTKVFLGDEAEKNVDTFSFRRIRLDLTGTVLERADYRLLPDFAGGKVVVQDAWLDLKANDAVKLQFGKFKEPFGLERLQSATALTFVERGLPTQLVPNRDLGVQVHGDVLDKKLAYFVGVFNGVADGGSSDGDVSDYKDVAARVFVTPVDGFGVGIAGTWGKSNGAVAQTDLPQLKTSGLATFFQYRAGTTLADTAIADGTHYRFTGQGHYYKGAAGVLAEYVRSTQDVAFDGALSHVSSQAWQLALNYVIAGGKTSFKSVAVDKPFSPSKHQWGAFEAAARYHELHVDDAAFMSAADPAKSARRARSFGVAFNWHLSKAVRFATNYELTTFRGGAADDGDRPTEHVILGRVQTVF